MCDEGRNHPAHYTANLGHFLRGSTMSTINGTVKRTTDRGFGFIAAPDGIEYFFHHTACNGTSFEALREGDSVTFTVGNGPKGPRAENVTAA